MTDCILVASTINDGGVVLGDADLMSLSQVIKGCAVELTAHIFRNDMAAGQDSDIFEHCLTAITESRSFDSCAFQCAAESVDYEGCQSFAFYVFSNDQEFLAASSYLFEELEHILKHVDLLVGDEDQRIVDNAFHLVRISYHVRAEVAAVELHAFYDSQVGSHGLGIFNSDNAVIADFVHSISNQFADGLVSGGNGCNVSDCFLAFYLNSLFLDFAYENFDSLFDALLQDHRVCTCCYVSHAFMDHGLSQEGCGCCAVACYVVCLCCDFLDELSAHVFKWILQFDFAGNGYTVVDDVRSAELLVQNDVAAFRSQCNLNCVSQLIDTSQQCCACFFIIKYFLCHLCHSCK